MSHSLSKWRKHKNNNRYFKKRVSTEGCAEVSQSTSTSSTFTEASKLASHSKLNFEQRKVHEMQNTTVDGSNVVSELQVDSPSQTSSFNATAHTGGGGQFLESNNRSSELHRVIVTQPTGNTKVSVAKKIGTLRISLSPTCLAENHAIASDGDTPKMMSQSSVSGDTVTQPKPFFSTFVKKEVKERKDSGEAPGESKRIGSIFKIMSTPNGNVRSRDLKDQWDQTVEIMSNRGRCKDPQCHDCSWPRAETPRINCVTARAQCPTIAAKFDEHVQVVYYDSVLKHITAVSVVAFCLLAAVFLMYMTGSNAAEFVDAEKQSFSQYPWIALWTYLICIGINFIILGFLWGVQAGCWTRCDVKKPRQTQSHVFGSRIKKKKVKRLSQHQQDVPCHKRAYEIARANMQIFQLAVLLPVIIAANTIIFFLYFGKFQVQREFFKVYFSNLETQIDNFFNDTIMVLEEDSCNLTVEDALTGMLDEDSIWSPPPNDAEVNASLWKVFIGSESARNLTTISEVTLEVAENHVEVAVFIFLVGVKFLVLFLMVVHHSGFWFVLVTALLNDATVIIVGFFSITDRCVRANFDP